ncbi:hypothetical protein DespoDRAFT_00090 [Desulfobacter postgatei 2ac9]|uniref:Replication initiation factor n=2 Tax=Desulfobacter postgatei TaxID=2293 RepID=I5AY23_9BACT|nr:hypothetical protein DespoDRAFT_00090 [Desulfobacter postgatei 2ac9]
MSNSKDLNKNCQSIDGSPLGGPLTGKPMREAQVLSSEGVQALITCTPQLVSLKTVYSNIDTLHLSVYADLSGSNLLEEIEKSREVAREFEKECIPFTYFSPQWNVHRSGRRFFTYHISMADTHIYFNKRSVHGDFPTCLIEIGSMSSHHPGAFSVFEDIKKFLKSCDISIKKHHVTRVDLSTDFVNINFRDLDLHNIEKWITRAIDAHVHYVGRSVSGISIGKGALMCRIYDKRKELNVKQATAKTDFFNRQWGLVSDDKKTPVVRVEFQFRREALKEFKTDDLYQIDTVDDLQGVLNGLWGYSSKSWAKHCETEVDRSNNNQSRDAVISPFWKLVQLVDFNAENSNLWRHREKNQYINVKALIDQGIGCLTSAVAATIESMDDFKDVAIDASTIVWRELRNRIELHTDELYEKMEIVFNRNNLNLSKTYV